MSGRCLDFETLQRVPMAKDGLIAEDVARNEPTELAASPASESNMTYRFEDLWIVCLPFYGLPWVVSKVSSTRYRCIGE
jgi:hypothetical protein